MPHTGQLQQLKATLPTNPTRQDPSGVFPAGCIGQPSPAGPCAFCGSAVFLALGYVEFQRNLLQTDRLSQSERVRDLLGESPFPQTQLSLRADVSFLPGATSEGSNSPSDSNRIKLTIFVSPSLSHHLCHQCGLSLLLPEIALDCSYIQTTISDPTWAVSTGPRWLSCCSICWQFLAEVSPGLDLTIPLKAQAWQARGGLSRKFCLANARGGDFILE